MIVTTRIVARIALLLVTGVVVQLAFLSQTPLFGATPDLVPVLVVSLGLLGGGVVGAVCGFSAGLLVDAALLQTLGVSSLTLLTVGYLAGRYREVLEISNSLIPPLLAAALTLLSASAYAAIQLMLGVEAPISPLVVREILLQAIWAFFLAIPTYLLVRRLLRPALVEDVEPRRRRRPGYATPVRTR